MLTALEGLEIPYESFEHPPVFTSDDVEKYWRDIPATPVKNLFLRNKKGNRHYLVIVGVEKRVDLQQLVKIIVADGDVLAAPPGLRNLAEALELCTAYTTIDRTR